MYNRLFVFFGVLVLLILIVIGILLVKNNNLNVNVAPSPTPATETKGITFPKGGETLNAGQTYTLTWNSLNEDMTQIFLIDTSLESQGESVSVVDRVFNIPNTGKYSYTIPANTRAGTYVFTIGNLRSNPFSIEPSLSFCAPSAINSTITTEGAAGSIFGTFKLTNTSNKTCKIMGNQFIKAGYNSNIKNIKIIHTGQTQKDDFVLAPDQTIYSQVRVQNGPQCLGETVSTPIEFSYSISPNEVTVFKNGNNSSVNFQSCSASDENTIIEIWNMQKTPITP